MNWEILDSEGNLFVTGQNNKSGKKYIEIYIKGKMKIHWEYYYLKEKKSFFSW